LSGTGSANGGVLQDSAFIQHLSAAVARPFKVGFSNSLQPVFITAAIVTGVAFVLIWFMKELPLRNQSGIQARLAEEGGPAPVADMAHTAQPPHVDGRVNGAPVAVSTGGNGRHALAAGDNNTGHNTAGATSMASVSEGTVPAHTGGMPIYGHVRRSDGGPIADAALTLIDPSGRQVGRGVSAMDGGYQLAVPGAGTYVLIASAAAHQPQASAVPVGGGPVSLDVVLSGTSGLSGTVTSAGKGAPVAGATATLADDRGEVVGARTTDAAGRYVFGELVAGTYTLVVSADGFRPAALSVSVPGAGEAVQDVDLAGGSTLRGVATVAGGRAVPDARITLLDRAGNVVAVTTTDAAGEYGFSDLPEGEYTVIASGYPPVASAMRVHGGDFSQHDVRLGHPDA
jgi:carboxypeptidase family protein